MIYKVPLHTTRLDVAQINKELKLNVNPSVDMHRYLARRTSSGRGRAFGFRPNQITQRSGSQVPCQLNLMCLHECWVRACHTRDRGAHFHNGSAS